ncbi:hypothetical protein [Bartonella sp. DGB2]|uniref:hypothetical protein n=1 Tax=Bartonella sp. DGB2 TaxID=3388426 RepID=UPI0039902CA6
MKHFTKYLYLAILSLPLAACALPDNYAQRTSAQIVPMGVDGLWVDNNGIVSSFSNGFFETRAPDTREKLSEGNYAFQSPNLIDIHMRSLVRGTVSRVTCALAENGVQLFCTQDSGVRFSLARKI